jgi:hypothetical protein
MGDFDHILNWTLKQGSHKFPGKDGGTCINEAALVAAGYEYRPIQAAEQMPACFSRPICRYAMCLNDEATDVERQQLLRFVTRLACADSPEIEREREGYIAFHSRRRQPFMQRLEVLEGALAIGRQADPLGPGEVRTRLDDVKGRATTSTVLLNTPLSAKVKSWFGFAKEGEPSGH